MVLYQALKNSSKTVFIGGRMGMHERIMISDAFIRKTGSTVTIAGWVDKIRLLGGVIFIVVRDRSGRIQVVAKRNVSEKAFKTARDLGQEDVILVKGKIVESKVSLGGKEIVTEDIKPIALSAKPIPIDPHDWEKTSLSKRLDWRFLDLREPRNTIAFRVADLIVNSLREFYRERGFIEIFTPKIVAEATEGGAEVFPVIYFEKNAFLAQSPQLYKQMMMAAGFERVFEVGPAYRAEKHHTTRHLTEYESIDIEMSFIEDHEDVMRTVEKAVIYTINRVGEKYSNQIRDYFQVDLKVPKHVPRITLADGHKLLREKGFKPKDPLDLDTEGERKLGEIVEEEYDVQLFYVTDYPWESRPFYTMKKPENPFYTRSYDLIYKGLELVSGSQREHRYEMLRKQIIEKGLDPESFDFYLKFFKYGTPPHGGAGLGLERFVMRILELRNIREARLLPRDPERITP